MTGKIGWFLTEWGINVHTSFRWSTSEGFFSYHLIIAQRKETEKSNLNALPISTSPQKALLVLRWQFGNCLSSVLLFTETLLPTNSYVLTHIHTDTNTDGWRPVEWRAYSFTFLALTEQQSSTPTSGGKCVYLNEGYWNSPPNEHVHFFFAPNLWHFPFVPRMDFSSYFLHLTLNAFRTGFATPHAICIVTAAH